MVEIKISYKPFFWRQMVFWASTPIQKVSNTYANRITKIICTSNLH